MKRSILRMGTTAQVVLAFLTLVMCSPANAASPLRPEQAFNSRVVGLDYAPSPEARGGVWWLRR